MERKDEAPAERVAHYKTYPSKEVPRGLETTYKAGPLYASLHTEKYGINIGCFLKRFSINVKKKCREKMKMT